MVEKPVHPVTVESLVGGTDLIRQADQIALPIGRRNRCQRKHMTFDDIFFHGREVKDLLRILQGSGRMGEDVEPVVL